MNQTPPNLPIPRISIGVREGTLSDLPFIDRLQKLHSRMVSFMTRETLEGKINLKHVLIAEEPSPDRAGTIGGPGEGVRPVGYCIGNDKYFKRENVGVIYQLNVAPGKQRNLVGAQLVKAMFDRAAYGCTLFCLWCAQDLEANHFWESIGFIPLAFRAGSRAKDRLHIFWQKRIREGDTTTPWWYPTETTGGMMGEARLVFPIPPGVRWNDPMPRVLPKEQLPVISCQLPEKNRRAKSALATGNSQLATPCTLGRLRFTRPVEKKEKPRREKPPKMKNDPALVAKARELNARWMEEINRNPTALPEPAGKYAVSRQIEERSTRLLLTGKGDAGVAPANHEKARAA